MACDQNLIDIVQQEMEQRYALALPSVAIGTLVGGALDAVLLSLGVATGLDLFASPSLEEQLQQSHQEYVNTSTSTRTRTRLDCQDATTSSGRGQRTPEDVVGIVNRNVNSVTARVNTALVGVDGELGDAWRSTLADVHNCIEEAITDGFVVRQEPGPRCTVRRTVRVCDRYVGE